ncbi:hypothetical protein ACLVWU_08485 [Bdellovibrio sp. HCB290]|uniref:hypothetical protein n=1 Tax=Bdellovibrio sp. HCB290 TaxID=3394356 RepID=UPI0039B5A641
MNKLTNDQKWQLFGEYQLKHPLLLGFKSNFGRKAASLIFQDPRPIVFFGFKKLFTVFFVQCMLLLVFFRLLPSKEVPSLGNLIGLVGVFLGVSAGMAWGWSWVNTIIRRKLNLTTWESFGEVREL